MVSTTDVKRALSALATRTDTATRPYVAVIDEAEAARTDLRRAAAFVDSIGLDRLSEAVATAERDGDEAAAERGRAALATYRAFREAAGGDREATAGDRDERTADHFRSAPGTPKSDTGQHPAR